MEATNNSVFEVDTKGKQLTTEEDVQSLHDQILKVAETVKVIKLCGNSYGTAACESLARALSHCSKLEVLDMSDAFTGRLRSEIPGSLTYVSNALIEADCKLVELDLSHNAFGPDGVNGFKELLKNMPSLKALKVTNNGLSSVGGKMIADALIEGDVKLELFWGGRNRLEEDGAKGLGFAFAHMKTLKDLRVPQNGIREEGMQGLLDSLVENNEIEHIAVNDNFIKEGNLPILCKVVRSAPALNTLNVSDCMIGEEGSILLSEALTEGCPNLQTLEYCYNEMESKESQQAFLEMLATKKNLQTVEIKGNEFGSKMQKAYLAKFAELEKKKALGPFESDDEDDEDDDDEEDDDDAEDQLADAVNNMKIQFIHNEPDHLEQEDFCMTDHRPSF